MNCRFERLKNSSHRLCRWYLTWYANWQSLVPHIRLVEIDIVLSRMFEVLDTFRLASVVERELKQFALDRSGNENRD